MSDKMYCLPRARVLVETFSEAVVDLVDDLLPLVVVDDVALEVEVSPMTVLSCAEKLYLLLQLFYILP